MMRLNHLTRQWRSALAIAGGCIALMGTAGCGEKEAAVTVPTQTPQQAVATDSRIPPEKQAQIQQIIAQQQAAHAPGAAAH
ncbi:hypothetical protein [Capsulimonas corticalis]|nr:hypothetical protein [Capsulimonas corticalis]